MKAFLKVLSQLYERKGNPISEFGQLINGQNPIGGGAPLTPGSAPGGINNLAAYAPAIAQALQRLTSTQGQQSALAAQLATQANGGGPAPEVQALKNATQQNVQNAAGATASTLGVNPALQARQIQDQAANLNQQAAGQASQLEQQREVAAENAEGQVLGTQGTEANTLLSTGANANNAQNTTNVQNQGLNQASQTAGLNAETQLIGAGLGAAGTTGAAALKGAGMAEGGDVGVDGAPVKMDPKMMFIEHYRNSTTQDHAMQLLNAYQAGKMVSMVAGGPVEAQDASQEATVPGNSPANDKIPIMASQGEEVVPRETLAKGDAAILAFIHGHRSSEGASDSSRRLIQARRAA